MVFPSVFRARDRPQLHRVAQGSAQGRAAIARLSLAKVDQMRTDLETFEASEVGMCKVYRTIPYVLA